VVVGLTMTEALKVRADNDKTVTGDVPVFLALDDMTAINYLHEPVRPSAFPLQVHPFLCPASDALRPF